VRNATDLRNQVGLFPIGSKVELEVYRKGVLGKAQRETISAVVSEQTELSADGAALKNPRLAGATFGDIPRDSPAYGHLEGVMVIQIEKGSRAWTNGLRQGDVVDGVNQLPVRNMEEFLEVAGQSSSGLLLHIRRGDAAAFVVMR
jgi:serine protease Do/serine protease DegQ